MFIVDFVKMFPYTAFLEHNSLEISNKWCRLYVRNTKFLPEIEISSEIKVQSTEENGEDDDNVEH
jgi:hypothetical protein